MKEIVLINAFTETKKKLDNLRNLIESIKSENFEVCLITHTSTPQDIVDRCDYFIYDKKNPIVHEPEFQYEFWFNCDEYKINFVSHKSKIHFLAYYRLIFGGLAYLKSLGYQILHSFDYDIIFGSFDELHENRNILNEYDLVAYHRDDNTKVSYFSVNLEKIDINNLVYDENNLRFLYKEFYSQAKYPLIENLLFEKFLPKKIFEKNLNCLYKNCEINTHFFGNENRYDICFFVQENDLYVFVFKEGNEKIELNILYCDNKHVTFYPEYSQYYYIDSLQNIEYLKVFLNNKLYFDYNLPDLLTYIGKFVNFYKK